tara:strand:- start:61 stop:294 length:234 start_codon:yes stop_codon:yes gene_type:complete
MNNKKHIGINLQFLSDCKEYYKNAPDKIWDNKKVLSIVNSGNGLKTIEYGGLMFGTFDNYTFKFYGIPVKCINYDWY